MRVLLGTFSTVSHAQFRITIAPKSPRWISARERYEDSGSVIALEPISPDQNPEESLTFEPTSEDMWRLREIIGDDLRQVVDDHRRYLQRPYFWAYDHRAYGRLYAEPLPPGGNGEGVLISTRPEPPTSMDRESLDQTIKILSLAELDAFLVADRINNGLSWMPSEESLAAAIRQGREESRSIMQAKADYQQLILVSAAPRQARDRTSTETASTLREGTHQPSEGNPEW